eukprot:751626-Hanusia_phi.AAC.1
MSDVAGPAATVSLRSSAGSKLEVARHGAHVLTWTPGKQMQPLLPLCCLSDDCVLARRERGLGAVCQPVRQVWAQRCNPRRHPDLLPPVRPCAVAGTRILTSVQVRSERSS